jgi:hypothetical protein
MEDPQRHIVRRQGWKSDAEGPLQSRHGNGAWSRCGVLYVYDDKMMGGNLAFAFIGNYRESAGEVLADLSTLRHNDDPAHQPLLKTRRSHPDTQRQTARRAISFRGRHDGIARRRIPHGDDTH